MNHLLLGLIAAVLLCFFSSTTSQKSFTLFATAFLGTTWLRTSGLAAHGCRARRWAWCSTNRRGGTAYRGWRRTAHGWRTAHGGWRRTANWFRTADGAWGWAASWRRTARRWATSLFLFAALKQLCFSRISHEETGNQQRRKYDAIHFGSPSENC